MCRCLENSYLISPHMSIYAWFIDFAYKKDNKTVYNILKIIKACAEIKIIIYFFKGSGR